MLYFHAVIKYGHKGAVLLHIKEGITCSQLTFRWIIIQQSLSSFPFFSDYSSCKNNAEELDGKLFLYSSLNAKFNFLQIVCT